MRAYRVEFNPKTRKTCAWSFPIVAESASEAERIARRELALWGETITHFKKPRVFLEVGDHA